jgi:hypothetical protein
MEEIDKKNSDRVGPLIGSVIIILIIIAGAFYLFSLIRNKVEVQEINSTSTQESISNQSDEILDIESDINSTETDSLEEDMQALEVEFQI